MNLLTVFPSVVGVLLLFVDSALVVSVLATVASSAGTGAVSCPFGWDAVFSVGMGLLILCCNFVDSMGL